MTALLAVLVTPLALLGLLLVAHAVERRTTGSPGEQAGRIPAPRRAPDTPPGRRG